MRISIPGFDGVYFDTDAESSALTLAFTAAGRRAPKPQGYAVQLLPYLWSFDVDLREVPNDHPVQYLHPEGAQSLGELPAERGIQQAGAELETVLRFVWAVNDEVESATGKMVGRQRDHDGVTIEITDGSVGVDGEELETDEFDIDEESSETTIDIEDDPTEQPGDSADPDHEFGDNSERDLGEY
ncbi:hypothetical protein QA600_15385 [Natronococcus sp. A-GB1]|uniref:hypothetical protein n=1 Tax=Natronococcus sp. A-GB1 TaxID=3037648 RepID=UPI00241C41BB|nr:hypothetical protein [Natronococcus sp. A-GB1]MDG5760719.1 hypothetical protein [Natronococcus sp. A-GB1]